MTVPPDRPMSTLKTAIITILAFVGLLTVGAGLWGAFSAEGPAESLSVEDIVRMATPSVVTIKLFDGDGKQLGTGSGFVVSANGLIVTNHHVIDPASKADAVFANGDVLSVEGVVHEDRVKDLAIIRVRAVELRPLSLATTEDVHPGATAIALGSPLGLQLSVSTGIVSGVRADEGRRVIQHSAAISPGSSGSPLLDESGNVVGVNTFIVNGGDSLAFAVPVGYIKPFITGDAVRPVPLPERRAKRVQEEREEFLNTLRENTTVYSDPEEGLQFVLPKAYRTSRSANADGAGRQVSVIAQSPDAQTDGTSGWLSDGIRIVVRRPPEGRVWSDSYRGEWPTQRIQTLVEGYTKQDIEELEVATLFGLNGMSARVVGESPRISEPEFSYVYALASPSCLVSVELTSPVSSRKATDLLNALIQSATLSGC